MPCRGREATPHPLQGKFWESLKHSLAIKRTLCSKWKCTVTEANRFYSLTKQASASKKRKSCSLPGPKTQADNRKQGEASNPGPLRLRSSLAGFVWPGANCIPRMQGFGHVSASELPSRLCLTSVQLGSSKGAPNAPRNPLPISNGLVLVGHSGKGPRPQDCRRLTLPWMQVFGTLALAGSEARDCYVPVWKPSASQVQAKLPDAPLEPPRTWVGRLVQPSETKRVRVRALDVDVGVVASLLGASEQPLLLDSVSV